MNKPSQILILFLLTSLFTFSQRIIDDDVNFATIFENQDIIITPTDDNIIIVSSIIRTTTNSIQIIPTVNYSVTIIPDNTFSKIGQGSNDDEERPASRISIYPNPTGKTITINSKEKIATLKLYNNYGIQQIDPIIKKENTINLASYSNGIYTLKIYLNNGEVLTKTIVKQ